MSFTTFSTIGSNTVGISNVAKKNIVPGIPSHSLKHTNIDYQTAFVFGPNIWNSILPTQRYTNSRTIGSAALLTGTQAWLNGTYTWSSTNATYLLSTTLGHLTDGDNSTTLTYKCTTNNPITITISLPSTIRIELIGISWVTNDLYGIKGSTITIDGSNDNGLSYDNNIASFTPSVFSGYIDFTTTTSKYNMIRFNIPYISGNSGNVYIGTLNLKMNVYSSI